MGECSVWRLVPDKLKDCCNIILLTKPSQCSQRRESKITSTISSHTWNLPICYEMLPHFYIIRRTVGWLIKVIQLVGTATNMLHILQIGNHRGERASCLTYPALPNYRNMAECISQMKCMLFNEDIVLFYNDKVSQ
jgi:hypothetical protein